MRVSRWPDNAGAVIFLCFLIGLIGLIGWTDPGLAQSGPKRIYIAPDDHTDYLWSGDEEAYRQAFIEMIDYYLDLADTTEKNPSEHQSRWNCDGSFWVWEYERSKPVADVQRLVRRIRDGHISVPLNALVSTYGGAVIRAKLSSDGGHYSPTHSRLDWLTLNHYAAMSGDDGAGIVLSSADLSFMKLGRSAVVNRVSNLDVATPLISVLAGGQVDGPKMGMVAQGGDSYFLQRFALRPHGRFDAVDAMKFALEHQNPLVTGFVRGRGKGAYPETSFSLGAISDPNVVLWALKPAEEGIGKGIIARVWNLSSEPRKFSLSLATGISGAQRATHIETNIEAAAVSGGALSASAAPSQVLTFRLFPGDTGKRPAALRVRPSK